MPGTVKPICPGLRLGAMPSADRHTDSLPIGTLSVVAHVLRKHGHDADALLRRHRVGVRTLSDPNRTVADSVAWPGSSVRHRHQGHRAPAAVAGRAGSTRQRGPGARAGAQCAHGARGAGQTAALRPHLVPRHSPDAGKRPGLRHAGLRNPCALCGQPALVDRLSGRRRAQPGASLRHRMAPGPRAHGAAPAGGLCALHRVLPRAGVVRTAAP